MRIGILGYGVVGSGLIEILDKNKDKRKISVESILVRDKKKHLKKSHLSKVTTDINEFLSKDIDILVEVMGGLYPAYDYIKLALKEGIHVVTANKDLIAEHGKELLEVANMNNVSIKFEASVGGGIPVIKPLVESLEGNEINSINAILNGTTNFILSKMYNENLNYREALKQAQELGFAESNPDSDVLGYDAARKLSILSTIAYDSKVYWKDLHLEGITKIDEKDIMYAKKLNCKIKLVGQSIKENGKISAFVRPVLVDNDNILARVDNEYNAVVLNGDSVGEVSFLGKGAGKMATGSAVYSDIIDIIENRSFLVNSFSKEKINVNKVFNNKCSAVIRFSNYKKENIFDILSQCVDKFSVIDESEELALMVSAKSEYEINNSLCVIKNKGYCENANKILKIC